MSLPKRYGGDQMKPETIDLSRRGFLGMSLFGLPALVFLRPQRERNPVVFNRI